MELEELILSALSKDQFIETLHHSIDCFVEKCVESDSNCLFIEYGFKSSSDFQMIILALTRLYRYLCIESISWISLTDEDSTNNQEKEEHATKNILILMDEIAHTRSDLLKLSSEQQDLLIKVFLQRKDELLKQLIREHNAQKCPFVTSFDWDVRLIMGCYSQNCRLLTTLTLNLYKNTQDSSDNLNPSFEHSQFHCQMDREMLDKFIENIEHTLQKSNISETNIQALDTS